jgi:hypothetical protein
VTLHGVDSTAISARGWTIRRIDAELAKKGRFYEHSRNCPRTADCVVHDRVAALEAQDETPAREFWNTGVWITKDVPALRIDHIPDESQLHGMWQALCSGCVFDFKEMKRRVVGLARTSHQGDNF